MAQRRDTANTASTFIAPITYYTISPVASHRISMVVHIGIYTPKEPHILVDTQCVGVVASPTEVTDQVGHM